MNEPTTLPAVIAHAAAQFGDAEVIFHAADDTAEKTTIGELYGAARCIAARFRTLGIGPGDIVAIQLPNWRECVLAHSATWLAGATVLPIVSIYGPNEVDFILRQSGAMAYVGPREWRGRDHSPLFETACDIASIRHRFVVRGELDGVQDFSDLERSRGTGEPEVDSFDPGSTTSSTSSTDRAVLVYTSGTTAEPKGVQHSHRTLLAEIDSMEQHRGTAVATSTLAVFPPGHIAGVLGILRAICRNALTVLMEAWDPVAATRLIAEHRLESSAGAPIHLAGILDAAEISGADISCMREYTTGAANVSADLIRRADVLGVHAFRCYGSTEHPTVSSGVAADPLDKRASTDGRLTPGTSVRIVDDSDNPVAPGIDGEILCRGPEQFTGYTDAALTDDGFTDRWFRTGDIGRLDTDGYLTITDRKKDIIVRGGENISSREVEDILLTHPGIVAAAAVAMPDERYGEKVCAFITVREGVSLDVADVRQQFAIAGAARQKAPERLELVTELPVNASGKVQKSVLRRRLLEQ